MIFTATLFDIRAQKRSSYVELGVPVFILTCIAGMNRPLFKYGVINKAFFNRGFLTPIASNLPYKYQTS